MPKIPGNRLSWSCAHTGMPSTSRSLVDTFLKMEQSTDKIIFKCEKIIFILLCNEIDLIIRRFFGKLTRGPIFPQKFVYS